MPVTKRTWYILVQEPEIDASIYICIYLTRDRGRVRCLVTGQCELWGMLYQKLKWTPLVFKFAIKILCPLGIVPPVHWTSHPHWPGLSNCPVQSVHNLLHLLSEYDLLNHLRCIGFFRFILDRHGAKGSMCLHKEWASTPTPFAFQTTVADIATYAPEYREKTMTLSEFFPAKSQCFVMSPPHYGSLAEVPVCLSLSLC